MMYYHTLSFGSNSLENMKRSGVKMISVLMSVYNESLDEIQQSIDSILLQSYREFELIIVLDNPNYTEGRNLLKQYSEKDARIHIYVNKVNVGLALSMNRAAKHAKGEFLLRMDADDVCFPNRFQIEYDLISKGDYDLVCGNFEFIDEDNNILSENTIVYTDSQLNALLPYRNIIHHPTVIMTTKIFNEVGGYRNYLCAQDYDLWLRLKCAGARMHMMPEKMIQYRVRSKSTTSQKRYKQSCTLEYIRALYRKQRMRGYSYEGYLMYLEKRKADDPVAQKNFLENYNKYMLAQRNLKDKKLIKATKEILSVLFKSKYYRPHMIRSLKIYFLTRLK